ncbi:hypothetical protein NIA71_08185 [Ihubacter massiliensis]|uniref:hypothetical protein n=1 Tax=Ihubacter massiliensis TaxID=1852367 RepID=UPI00209690CE|nr:hypothetical protein [Ihubacter massiliensis]MCO7121928.1 hypothetical protein [Ihubacter massiliensis]
MRDYIPKSCELPDNLARQVYWLVKDYDRMKLEYDNAIWDSPGPPDGQPRGGNTSDPTSKEAIKRAELFKKIQAIEQSKLEIPEQYREGIWNNIVHRTPYPIIAGRTTWWTYKTKFLRKVAEKLYWI